MTVLTALSEDLASIVESAGKGVVQVNARRGSAASGIVWSADGLVVTADHALVDEDIKIGTGNGKPVKGTLVGRDPTTDVALLRVEKGLAAPLQWTGVKGLKVGHLVLALARPGKTVRATLGILSALGEGWRTSAGGNIDSYIQTDGSSPPGFSGGPLVTADAKVIGMTTSGLLRTATVAVPTSTIKSVVDELLKHGRIARGYLGVGVQPARLPPAVAREAGQEIGLLVVSIDPGSPSDQAGLVLGDTILAIGGNVVGLLDDLLATLTKDQIGATVPLRILRAGRLQEIKVTIGEHK